MGSFIVPVLCFHGTQPDSFYPMSRLRGQAVRSFQGLLKSLSQPKQLRDRALPNNVNKVSHFGILNLGESWAGSPIERPTCLNLSEA